MRHIDLCTRAGGCHKKKETLQLFNMITTFNYEILVQFWYSHFAI